MAVYSAKAAATAISDPSGWPHGWPFPPAGGNDGPWGPGQPAAVDDTFIAQASNSTTGKYSQDSGATWTSLTLPASTTYAGRCWCGQGNLIFYIKQETMTVYASIDGGLTWNTRAAVGLHADNIGTAICSIAIHDNMLYVLSSTSANPATYATGISVWYSNDGAATFTETSVVAGALGYGAVGDIVVLANGTVVCSCKNHGAGAADTVFFKSTDSGATFSTAGTISSKTFEWLAADGDGTNLIATGTSGMQLSTNTGTNWTSVSATGHGPAVGYGDNMLSYTHNTKLRQSADNGATWSDSDSIALNRGYAHLITAWSGGFALASGATVKTSTGTSTFATTDANPGITPLILYAVEEV